MTSSGEKKIPVLIEFTKGSWILREATPAMTGDGAPKTYVVLPNGKRISIPTNQVVFENEENGNAMVGLGGMSYEGLDQNEHVFWKVQDLLDDAPFEFEDVDKLSLEPSNINRISLQGLQIWPKIRVSEL